MLRPSLLSLGASYPAHDDGRDDDDSSRSSSCPEELRSHGHDAGGKKTVEREASALYRLAMPSLARETRGWRETMNTYLYEYIRVCTCTSVYIGVRENIHIEILFRNLLSDLGFPCLN